MVCELLLLLLFLFVIYLYYCAIWLLTMYFCVIDFNVCLCVYVMKWTTSICETKVNFGGARTSVAAEPASTVQTTDRAL